MEGSKSIYQSSTRFACTDLSVFGQSAPETEQSTPQKKLKQHQYETLGTSEMIKGLHQDLTSNFIALLCSSAGMDNPEDLCILYSNRAACYLKDGNSTDCIQDCTKCVTCYFIMHLGPVTSLDS